LLKNLSIPSANKILLGQLDLTQKLLVDMAGLAEERDVVGSVQGGALGIVKNLCKGNVVNATLFALGSPLPSSASSSASSPPANERTLVSSPLSRLLAFISRTNDLPLRTEATRVLSAAVRSVHLSPLPLSPSNATPSSPFSFSPLIESPIRPSSSDIRSAKDTLGSDEAVVEALTRMLRDALGEELKSTKAAAAAAAHAQGGESPHAMGRGRFEVVLVEAIVGLILLASTSGTDATSGTVEREGGKLPVFLSLLPLLFRLSVWACSKEKDA
jgi:hypothetical protein